jgi:hypothetical protein
MKKCPKLNIKKMIYHGELWAPGTLIAPTKYSGYLSTHHCGLILEHSIREGKLGNYIVTKLLLYGEIMQHTWDFVRADFVKIQTIS